MNCFQLCPCPLYETFVCSYTQFLAFVIVILIGILLSPPPVSCRHSNVTDIQCMRRLSNRYMLVENTLLPSTTQSNNGNKIGSSTCPWTWTTDDDPNRIPRYLYRAVCPKCEYYCKPVSYTHHTLQQKCKRKAGGRICVWNRKERELNIAYVFDP